MGVCTALFVSGRLSLDHSRIQRQDTVGSPSGLGRSSHEEREVTRSLSFGVSESSWVSPRNWIPLRTRSLNKFSAGALRGPLVPTLVGRPGFAGTVSPPFTPGLPSGPLCSSIPGPGDQT